MEFALVPRDMASASDAVANVSDAVRGADGAAALTTLASALPGTSTAAYMSELGGLWRDGVTGWCESVDALREGIDAITRDGTATDDLAGDALNGLKTLLGVS